MNRDDSTEVMTLADRMAITVAAKQFQATGRESDLSALRALVATQPKPKRKAAKKAASDPLPLSED